MQNSIILLLSILVVIRMVWAITDYHHDMVLRKDTKRTKMVKDIIQLMESSPYCLFSNNSYVMNNHYVQLKTTKSYYLKVSSSYDELEINYKITNSEYKVIKNIFLKNNNDSKAKKNQMRQVLN